MVAGLRERPGAQRAGANHCQFKAGHGDHFDNGGTPRLHRLPSLPGTRKKLHFAGGIGLIAELVLSGAG